LKKNLEKRKNGGKWRKNVIYLNDGRVDAKKGQTLINQVALVAFQHRPTGLTIDLSVNDSRINHAKNISAHFGIREKKQKAASRRE
jgi:hypothetical protein